MKGTTIMMKRKLTALFILSGGFLFALGMNCLPNIGVPINLLGGTTG
ncbi:MAG: hypothetical protein IH986_08730 [Planctomycetes bacterium]|nr:hypothetical protein [Planctomycetota bacterium]